MTLIERLKIYMKYLNIYNEGKRGNKRENIFYVYISFSLQESRQWGCTSREYGTAGMGMRTDPGGKSRPLTTATVPLLAVVAFLFILETGNIHKTHLLMFTLKLLSRIMKLHVSFFFWWMRRELLVINIHNVF